MGLRAEGDGKSVGTVPYRMAGVMTIPLWALHQAGEVLFVPAGFAHAVDNITLSKLPVLFKLTNTDAFDSCFVVTGDVTPSCGRFFEP